MATLTPDIAQNLIWRSMATGVPTTEFEKYGGYEAVYSLYQSTGGQMSFNAIPTDLRNELAQTVAQTGSGNLSILKETGTPLTTEGAANMVRNGIDPTIIDRFVESGIPFAEGALDAAKFATSTGGYSEAEVRSMLEAAMKSGGYDTSKIDDWVGYAQREGVEKALTEFQKVNPGSGSAVTNISKDLGAASAKRILATTPEVGLPAVAAAIPSFNAANLYKPANFEPQQPFYPTQPQAGLRAAMQTPSLVDMPVARPTLTPQAAYLSQIPLVAEPVARPTLDAQTAYIDAPAQMRAGGVVGYQGGGELVFTPTQELGSNFDVSEYIDPETGRFYINEFQRDVVFNPQLREAEMARGRMAPQEEMSNYEQMLGRLRVPGTYRTPRNMAEGGLASVAQQVAAEGRRGDSTLVHMTNDEVAGLQSLAQMMGGSLTINPETGLPEANFFKKILPFVVAFAAPYLGPVAATLGMSGPVLAAGLAGAGTMLGGGSLKEGVKTGLSSFAAAGLTSGAMGADPLGATTGQSTFNIANTFGGAKAGEAIKVGEASGGVPVGAVDSTDLGAAFFPGDASYIDPTALQPSAGSVVPQAVTGSGAAKTAGMKIDPITGALLATTLYGGAEGLEESKEQQRLYEQQQAEIAAEQRRRKGAGYAAYERSGLASIPMGAGGGMVAMAGGGMTYMEAGGTTGPTGLPRNVTGTGDGMSDSVPATIEGVQEARLADGEFVIPADVVADIGNGSSDAGSKKLYDMMDRIRKARHGTTEQPPEINAEKLMPA
jgi:hypothetical protein